MFGRHKARHELKLRLEYEDGKSLELLVQLEYSARKSLSLRMEQTARLLLKAPLGMSLESVKAFILSKKDWIGRRAELVEQAAEQREALDSERLDFWKQMTRRRAEAFLSGYDGLKPKRLSVRQQKSRWGSYSSSGLLSINLNAARLDDALFEYLMIHELMHLYEMNHSPRFWSLVESRLPDYKERRQRLKNTPLL